jgi:hypothetical protein
MPRGLCNPADPLAGARSYGRMEGALTRGGGAVNSAHPFYERPA